MTKNEELVLKALADRWKEWDGGPVAGGGTISSPCMNGTELMSATGIGEEELLKVWESLIRQGYIQNEVDQALVARLTHQTAGRMGLPWGD